MTRSVQVPLHQQPYYRSHPAIGQTEGCADCTDNPDGARRHARPNRRGARQENGGSAARQTDDVVDVEGRTGVHPALHHEGQRAISPTHCQPEGADLLESELRAHDGSRFCVIDRGSLRGLGHGQSGLRGPRQLTIARRLPAALPSRHRRRGHRFTGSDWRPPVAGNNVGSAPLRSFRPTPTGHTAEDEAKADGGKAPGRLPRMPPLHPMRRCPPASHDMPFGAGEEMPARNTLPTGAFSRRKANPMQGLHPGEHRGWQQREAPRAEGALFRSSAPDNHTPCRWWRPRYTLTQNAHQRCG